MINLKDPKDQLPSILAIVGMLGLAVSGVNLYFAKPFSKVDIKKSVRKQQEEFRARYKKAETAVDESKAKLSTKLWDTKLDAVTPDALARITRLSEANKVTMVSFRPQKPNEGTVLLQQPYVLTVDGPFTNVANLVSAIENSDSKLAVSQIQFAASEGESDVVSAQIGLVAYLNKPEPEKRTTKPLTTSTPTSLIKSEVTSRG